MSSEADSDIAATALALSFQTTRALLRHNLLSPDECEACASALEQLAENQLHMLGPSEKLASLHRPIHQLIDDLRQSRATEK
ncbi:MAG: hypothetical protein GW855_07725 [Erythrobacter sp.]|nr:hypothetical protein [Erythrobacter sp.]NCQ62426.1 hypothetical protein [Alphaproteobacteria bacterium]